MIYIPYYVFFYIMTIKRHFLYIYVTRFYRNRKKDEDVDNMLTRVLRCGSILETIWLCQTRGWFILKLIPKLYWLINNCYNIEIIKC